VSSNRKWSRLAEHPKDLAYVQEMNYIKIWAITTY